MPNIAWNSSLYDQKHGFVSGYGQSLVEQLAPQAGERILDLGCGTGHLAQQIAESGAQVIGIDGSASMIEAAQASYPTLEFHVMDARDFTFAAPFDAVFSNATLHWIREADSVAAGIARILKPGGRLVLEMGGRGNVETIVSATRQALHELSPTTPFDDGWYFPSVSAYTTVIERQGLLVRSAVLFDRPTPLADGEQGLRTWLQMFGTHLFSSVSEQIREQALARIEELARPILFRDDHWVADYRRLRIIAYK